MMDVFLAPEVRSYLARWAAAQKGLPRLRQVLVEALRGRIPGFRTPLAAPAPRVQQALEATLEWLPSLACELACCWGEQHEELVTQARAALRAEPHGSPGEGPPEIAPEAWALAQAVARLRAWPQEGTDIMQADKSPADLPERFSRFLAELAALPAEAPEWDHVEAVRERLLALGAEKRAVRDARRRVASALEAVRALAADLNLRGVTAWSAEACPVEQLDEATEQLDQLACCLQELKTLGEMFARQPFAVGHAEQQRFGQLQETARRLEQDLTAMLQRQEGSEEGSLERPGTEPEPSVPVAPAPPPPGPAPEGPIPEVTGEEAPLPAVQTLWTFLARGDWEGAYWWARAVEATGEVPPAPSALLNALLGARAVAQAWPEVQPLLAEIREAIAQAMQTGGPPGLRAAAALPLSLLGPEATTYAWLEELRPPLDVLNPVLAAVRDFVARTGGGLQPEDLAEAQNTAALRAQVEAASREARAYLDRAGHRNPCGNYLPGNLVFRALTHSEGNDNLLYRLLAPVAQDARAEAPAVREHIEELEDSARLEQRLQRLHRHVLIDTGHSPQHLEGNRRLRLLEEVNRAVGIARRWIRGLDLLAGGQVHSWRQEPVRQLLAATRPGLQRALAVLEEVASHGDGQTPALARVFLALGRQLEAVLHQEPQQAGEKALQSLQVTLARRLLWCPQVPLTLSPLGLPEVRPEAWEALQEALERMPGPDPARLPALVREWLVQEDLRWIEELIAQIPEGNERRVLQEELQRIEDRLTELRQQAEQLACEVEQRVVEGSIPLDERTNLLTQLEQLQVDLAERRVPGAEVRERLVVLSRQLAERRQQAVDARRQKWEQLAKRMCDLLPADRYRELERQVQEALDQGNLYAADELLVYAEQAAVAGQSQGLQHLIEKAKLQARADLPGFLRAFEQLRETLERTDLQQIAGRLTPGEPYPKLGIPRLPRDRSQQVVEAFRIWTGMKRREAPQTLDRQAVLLLRYLGYEVPYVQEAVLQRQEGRDWVLLRVRAQVGAPVPEFGSEARGEVRVLVVWERPGVTQLEAILSGSGVLPTEPLIVVYLGRLLWRQRQDLARWAFQQGFRGLVLDEVLLSFLAREYELRFNTFAACALPWSAINPYRASVRGLDLPPEMFFGRREIVARILAATSTVYVYGGRQLGKSALLRAVEREFHHPQEDRYAFVLDIKNLGLPGGVEADPRQVWRRLITEAFSHIDAALRPLHDPPKVVERLQALFQSKPRLRVLLLLDEADQFLQADAAKGFDNVGRLNTLQTTTGGRLRLVFAGLKSVRRFRHLPNQPLGGSEERIGPLEPRAARALVLEPMRLLGYEVEDQALLGLLGITNYHPGLLQTFCERLVRELRGSGRLPPDRVTLADLEALFADPQLQQVVRDRFIWTLALDPHYQVMVRAMILDQMEAANGFSRAYTAGELGELGAAWWPEGFRGLRPEQVREYTEELEAMGVLVQQGEGFRLRSPNLVRLLGSRERVEDELLEALGQLQEEPWEQMDRLHPRLVLRGREVWSPLTQGQLRRLGAYAPGLTLLFGSPAVGLEKVQAVLEVLGELGAAGGPWQLTGPLRGLRAALQSAGSSAARPVMVLCWPEAAELVPAVLEAVAAQLAKARSGRVVCLIDPAGVDHWLAQDREKAKGIEDAIGALRLEPWSKAALRRALEELEVTGHDVEALYAETAGYHFLVDEWLQALRHGSRQAHAARTARNLLTELGLEGQRDLMDALACLSEWLEPEQPEDLATTVELLATELHLSFEVAQQRLWRLLYRGALVELAEETKVYVPALLHRRVTKARRP
ncbi:MAG: hypothetical protein KatS3mg131_0187 [Candidatus Tectimicrobiota bacterium]|nr:MAG: hypothetical protein KatS3mg131_0187 [Candidatus Tectomicrobia bacterium]